MSTELVTLVTRRGDTIEFHGNLKVAGLRALGP